MKDLISREAAHEMVVMLKQYVWRNPRGTKHRITLDCDDVQFGLDKIPAVDAVEAVYAEDYKHSFEMIAEKYAKIQDEMLKGELVEVVHAKWVDEYGGRYENKKMKCSACGEKAHHNDFEWILTPFCPNCGARMDGE